MNWLALGSEESIVTCNHDGQCSGEESCNCDDCTDGSLDNIDHCASDGAVQLSCTQDGAPAQTSSNWEDVPLDTTDNFDPTAEYRFKVNSVIAISL